MKRLILFLTTLGLSFGNGVAHAQHTECPNIDATGRIEYFAPEATVSYSWYDSCSPRPPSVALFIDGNGFFSIGGVFQSSGTVPIPSRYIDNHPHTVTGKVTDADTGHSLSMGSRTFCLRAPGVPCDGTLKFKYRLVVPPEGFPYVAKDYYIIVGGAAMMFADEAEVTASGYALSSFSNDPGDIVGQMSSVPADGVALHSISGDVYLSVGGARMYVNNVSEFGPLGITYSNLWNVPVQALNALPLVPRDGTLLRPFTSPEIYVVYGGVAFYIPDPSWFQALGLDPTLVRVAPAVALSQLRTIPEDGTLLKGFNQPKAVVFYGGVAFKIPDATWYPQLGLDPSKVRVVPMLTSLHTLDGPRDGTLLRTHDSPATYVYYGGLGFYLPDESWYQKLGLSPANVRMVPGPGAPQFLAAPRDYTLLRAFDSPHVYVVYGGAVFYLPDETWYQALNLNPANLRVVPTGALASIPITTTPPPPAP
ncbi:hypothetical protein ACLESD_13735 [Pyxidicoccus sp. 3LFB2]